MRRVAVRSLITAIAITLATGGGLLEACGPGNNTNSTTTWQHQTSRTVTVSESTSVAKLIGTVDQPSASGHAASGSVTYNSTTNTFLTICVKGLTLSDGTSVTFQVDGVTVGSGTVRYGRAFLYLSSKRGDTVPTVTPGSSTVTVTDPNNVIDLQGTFGALTTNTHVCGRW